MLDFRALGPLVFLGSFRVPVRKDPVSKKLLTGTLPKNISGPRALKSSMVTQVGPKP